MEDLLPDISDAHGDDVHWIPVQWRDFGGRSAFSGRVETLRCFEDNSKVRDILGKPGEGRVLVVDGHGNLNKALLGDLLAERAVTNGWEGIVVFGAVRDASALSKMPLGVKALGVCPIKTEKRGAGDEDVPLRIHDVPISPGDYLFADLNGVMVSQHPIEFGEQ
ncbi:ribonuclease activity regulator protein RraA [Enterovibrio norvegicus FF-33]|uniref:4-hydroxy-4-methyl-2-oxoglutarate aldolase n=1 Tax=Enterovibrio norvegicus FF-454 TaxID=1185651 RepID=A0A1E5BWI0_9GAMM|nr:putative 4-hydroxy-4-methyl-2-oxoglutarate aldolase [Enterovibrio norvegicus]OEE57608.1 ribonuclease activity regulator protein RraA [Enterovibrio norvegicus FF-454]OEE69695.1 ribonuclease activity regulator protein RraA [Enterovibrio norvegicus FF-33]OEE76884.1 ribonuclease activity regulator protein RraA [Enterovibrio norvegicus FF-162]